MWQPAFFLAHVKWFTRLMPGRPEPIREVLSAPFLAAWALTVGVMLALTYFNVPLQELAWVKRIHRALDRLRGWSLWVLRIGLAVPLAAAAWSGYLLHYELTPIPPLLRSGQIAAALLLLMPGAAGSPAGAALVGLLYLGGALHFGLHPLLDYVSWLGAAYWLLVRGTRLEGSGLPALYITTGLSLSWAAVEKWVYPHLSLDIIAHHGIPTFGLPSGLFLMLAGWVELGVGYLLITGVLNRFLSLVVTGLFVLTSAVFGWREILGHWQLHAALILFLISGTGRYPTPVLWHRTRPLQLAFVGVTLAPYVAGLLLLYYLL